MLDHRSENGRRKIDADVRAGICGILGGSPEDHGFTRPTWTLEILRAVVRTALRIVLPSENRIERLWLDLPADVTRKPRQKTVAALLDQVRLPRRTLRHSAAGAARRLMQNH